MIDCQLKETIYKIKTENVEFNFVTQKVASDPQKEKFFSEDKFDVDVAMVNPSPFFVQTETKFKDTGVRGARRLDLSLVDISMRVDIYMGRFEITLWYSAWTNLFDLLTNNINYKDKYTSQFDSVLKP